MYLRKYTKNFFHLIILKTNDRDSVTVNRLEGASRGLFVKHIDYKFNICFYNETID